MNLHDISEACEYKITGGDEYCWKCYGSYARTLDFESEHGYVSIIHDSRTQFIFEGTTESKADGMRPYRWVHPDVRDALKEEAVYRGVDNDFAWDEIRWIDLETEEDFLEKATAIMAGEEFDQRVIVPIELSDADFNRLAKMAHERDITFNELVCEILRLEIERIQREKDDDCSGTGCGNACAGCSCGT